MSFRTANASERVLTGQTEPACYRARFGSRLPALPFRETVMDAIREQTGIRIESRKGPAPILMIERAERPSEN